MREFNLMTFVLLIALLSGCGADKAVYQEDAAAPIPLEQQYDEFIPLNNGTVVVARGGKYGLITTSGRQLLSIESEEPDFARISGDILESCLEQDRLFWDDVLKRYDELSVLCSAEGPSPELIEAKAGQIRNLLSRAEGKMTDSQKTRFYSIQKRMGK